MAISVRLDGGSCTEANPPGASVSVSAWPVGEFQEVDSLVARFVNQTTARVFVAVNGQVSSPSPLGSPMAWDRLLASLLRVNHGGLGVPDDFAIRLQGRRDAQMLQGFLTEDPVWGQYTGATDTKGNGRFPRAGLIRIVAAEQIMASTAADIAACPFAVPS